MPLHTASTAAAVHFNKDGQVAGMLSVDGATGQVWFHSRQRAFVAERQLAR